jgi:phosphoribosyl-AMP cyclohydrolase
MTIEWWDQVKWDDRGLITAVAQDASSGRVLMVAWMNRESLMETATTHRAVYFSRSRGRLWRKGEESGNVQRVKEIRLDCDADVILLLVEQVGGIACHTGRESCLYLRLDEDANGNRVWNAVDPVLKDPATMYTTPKP